MIKQNVSVPSNTCDDIDKINLIAHKQNAFSQQKGHKEEYLNSTSSVLIAPHFYSECEHSVLFHLDIINKQLAIMQKLSRKCTNLL